MIIYGAKPFSADLPLLSSLHFHRTMVCPLPENAFAQPFADSREAFSRPLLSNVLAVGERAILLSRVHPDFW